MCYFRRGNPRNIITISMICACLYWIWKLCDRLIWSHHHLWFYFKNCYNRSYANTSCLTLHNDWHDVDGPQSIKCNGCKHDALICLKWAAGEFCRDEKLCTVMRKDDWECKTLFLNLKFPTSLKFGKLLVYLYTWIFWYEQNLQYIPGYKRAVILVMLCYCGCKQ